MGRFVLLVGLALASAIQLANAGAFEPMGLMMGMQRFNAPNKNPSEMNDDEMFSMFIKDPSYLLKPEEANPPDEDEDESDEVPGWEDEEEEEEEEEVDDYMDGTTRGLVKVGNDDDDDEDEDGYLDDYDDYGEGRSRIGNFGKQVMKQIGKVGLSMLKRGLKFLKSIFFKFGGKRLLKRAKDYLKNNAFAIEPISCENATCKSCAVFNLPFKVKSFKACAEMGFKRNRGKTNFTVDFNVVNKNMFHRDFEVGDIANCHQFESEPDSTYPIASLIGKVCVQGFQFKIESKKQGATKRKGKFCLALVFKRWATGYRFCVERKEKKEKGDKDKNKDKKEQLRKKAPSSETQLSKGKMRDTKNPKLVWKVELKKIAAGEQENQIVSDKPLFKGESQKRKEDAAKDLGAE